MIAFVSFSIDYHGPVYRNLASLKFRPGLLAAIQFGSTLSKGEICVTDEPDFPYIYVLFVEKIAPVKYLSTIQYIYGIGPSRHVPSLLNYTFGKGNCATRPLPVYVLRDGEILPPHQGIKYKFKFFDNYVVYYPTP